MELDTNQIEEKDPRKIKFHYALGKSFRSQWNCVSAYSIRTGKNRNFVCDILNTSNSFDYFSHNHEKI